MEKFCVIAVETFKVLETLKVLVETFKVLETLKVLPYRGLPNLKLF